MDFEVAQIYNFPKYLLKKIQTWNFTLLFVYFSLQSLNISQTLSSEQAEKQQEDLKKKGSISVT